MTQPATEAITHLATELSEAFPADTIVILGKGPSAEEVNTRVFKDRLTIGINDAERIHPTDVTIFYEDWVAESLQDEGLHTRAYVTSTDFRPAGKTVVKAPHRPLGNDEEDLMLSRFQSREEFSVEGAIFLSALELARAVADSKGRTQTVYMVGFDFTGDTGPARSATTSFAPDSSLRRANLEIQQYIMRNALYVLEDSNLDVKHVGTKEFSTLTVGELNAQHRVQVTRPGRVDDDAVETPTVEITAEITTNHFGDLNRLEQLVHAAHAAGADWVKVQKRDVDTFYTGSSCLRV